MRDPVAHLAGFDECQQSSALPWRGSGSRGSPRMRPMGYRAATAVAGCQRIAYVVAVAGNHVVPAGPAG